jgi:hypothetical protein
VPEIPPEIDIIEILYGSGDMTVPQVKLQVKSEETAWAVIPKLVAARIAALWVFEGDGVRELKDWELAAIVRSRTHRSAEVTPPDERLILRGAENLVEAYHRDFGNWYEQAFGSE